MRKCRPSPLAAGLGHRSAYSSRLGRLGVLKRSNEGRSEVTAGSVPTIPSERHPAVPFPRNCASAGPRAARCPVSPGSPGGGPGCPRDSAANVSERSGRGIYEVGPARLPAGPCCGPARRARGGGRPPRLPASHHHLDVLALLLLLGSTAALEAERSHGGPRRETCRGGGWVG